MSYTSNLRFNHVSKSFHHANSTTSIIHDVCYNFRSGLSYAIMGPSGIGKSTILHLLAGIELPNSGQVLINDVIIGHTSFQQRITLTHNSVGIVFQNPCLIYELSVLENVMLSAIAHNQINQTSQNKALQLLRDAGLEGKAHSAPNSLSGGQQQRIAILRALFNEPAFILADEPTGNLDSHSAENITQMLINCKKKMGTGLIISTHDQKVAQQCDVILKIEHQKLIAA